MSDYGEFAKLAPLMVLLDRLRMAGIDDGLIWVLPSDVLAGVTQAYGLPVARADVPEPLLAVSSPAVAAGSRAVGGTRSPEQTRNDYGDHEEVVPLLVVFRRLEEVGLCGDFAWVLPPPVLAGVTEAYSFPVIRADVPEPLLAFTISWRSIGFTFI